MCDEKERLKGTRISLRSQGRVEEVHMRGTGMDGVMEARRERPPEV